MLLYGITDDHPLRPHFRLGGIFEGFRLGLRLNGRAMAIRDTDTSTLELYKTIELNPKILLGVRFNPIDSPSGGDTVEKTMEKKSLLIVPLGNILYNKSKVEEEEEGEKEKKGGDKGHGYASLAFEDGDWDDTGFVLMLEIQKNGRPGHFYMVCNLTYVDIYDQPHTLDANDRNSDDRLFKFCGKSPPFTVAKVDGAGQSSLQASSFLISSTERPPPLEEIQLIPMSRSTPEIVETGMNGPILWSKGGDPPVALYPKRLG